MHLSLLFSIPSQLFSYFLSIFEVKSSFISLIKSEVFFVQIKWGIKKTYRQFLHAKEKRNVRNNLKIKIPWCWTILNKLHLFIFLYFPTMTFNHLILKGQKLSKSWEDVSIMKFGKCFFKRYCVTFLVIQTLLVNFFGNQFFSFFCLMNAVHKVNLTFFSLLYSLWKMC